MHAKLILGLGGAAAVVAVACSSSSSSDETIDTAQLAVKAREYYATRVHPAMGNCIACHSPGKAGPAFFATDATASYEALGGAAGLISDPNASPLVKYVHKDPKVVPSPEQRNVLTQWLTLEANARGLQGAVAKPKTITEAYKRFSDCMNYNTWTYYRMNDLAFAQTDDKGPCLGCHSTGQGGAWLSAGQRETFEKAKIFPYIQKLVVGKLDDTGSFEAIVPSNRFVEKSNELCPPESTTCHPTFGLPPNVRKQIEGFVDTTILNSETGSCDNDIVTPAPDEDAGADGGAVGH